MTSRSFIVTSLQTAHSVWQSAASKWRHFGLSDEQDRFDNLYTCRAFVSWVVLLTHCSRCWLPCAFFGPIDSIDLQNYWKYQPQSLMRSRLTDDVLTHKALLLLVLCYLPESPSLDTITMTNPVLSVSITVANPLLSASEQPSDHLTFSCASFIQSGIYYGNLVNIFRWSILSFIYMVIRPLCVLSFQTVFEIVFQILVRFDYWTRC